MAAIPEAADLRGRLSSKVGDLRQFASVRRIVLDDGQERDVRALAFSTGAGLDFWVLADRSLDVGPLWWRGAQLAWQGPNGFRAPQLHDQEGDGGRGFERSLSGLLVTCGLQHVRQPVNGQPLHGRLPLTPARVSSYGEDWRAGEPILFCEGEVTESSFHGGNLRLHRRIEAPIGGNVLRIIDEVENLDATPQPLAMLYHLNLGYPLVGTGTTVSLDGRETFHLDEQAPPLISCLAVTDVEQIACKVVAGPQTIKTAPSLSLTFLTEPLPYLQIWADLRPHRHILALEPATSMRLPEGISGPEPTLPPRGRSTRQLTIELNDAALP